jgi:hypothetical protein
MQGELKFEARKLTSENYKEFQSLNGSRLDNKDYSLRRSFSLGLSVNF